MRMSFDQKLLTLFFDYLEEVIKLKQSIATGDLDDKLPVTTHSAITYEQKISAYISQRLQRYIGRLEHGISQSYGVFEQTIFTEAKYVLAALTDEIFLFQFEQQQELPWLDVLLERKLFGSSIAGQKIFNNIETLVSNHSGDSTYVQLAKIYLIALHMGFSGRFRATGNKAALEDYKRQLTGFIGEDIPAVTNFFAIQPTRIDVRETNRNRMRALKPWFRIGAVTLVVYLIISSAVWLTSIRVLNRIILGME